jgi:hypothetical protein
MKQPRHWLDDRPSAIGARLLNTASREALPEGAMLRAGKRLGVSATLVGAASVASAGVANAEAAVGTTAALAAGNLTSASVLVPLSKAVAVGLAAGGLMVSAARWAALSHDETAEACSGAVSPIRLTVPERLAQVASPSASGSAAADSAHPGRTNAEALPFEGSAPMNTKPLSAYDSAAVRPVLSDTGNAPDRTVLMSQDRAQNAPTTPDEPRPAARENDTLTKGPSTPAVARFADDVQPVSVHVASTPPSSARLPASLAPPEPPAKRSALAAEVRAIDSVRSAIHSGEFQRAVAELAHGESAGTFVSLRAEAAVLRVHALSGTGRTTEATRLARQLLGGSLSPSQRQRLESWVAKRDKE